MDYLKQFLHDLTKDGIYYAEVVDSLAEIYIVGDTAPAVLLELQADIYHVNIRSDIPSRMVAQVVYDMTVIDEDIAIGPDFFISPEGGILYGQEAAALFFATVYSTMEEIQSRQETELDNVIYIAQEPIYGYGYKNETKPNKLQKMWGTDLE